MQQHVRQGGVQFCRRFTSTTFSHNFHFSVLSLLPSLPEALKMGVVRHEWKTLKKARFFSLLERGLSIPTAAKELSLNRVIV